MGFLAKLKKSSIIFWVHWLVALIGHLLLVIMPIGLFKMFFNENWDMWTKLFIFGCMYMGMLYTVNHITHSEGFCILTDLENHFREKEGLDKAGKRYIPRFYKKNLELWLKVKSIFKK